MIVADNILECKNCFQLDSTRSALRFGRKRLRFRNLDLLNAFKDLIFIYPYHMKGKAYKVNPIGHASLLFPSPIRVFKTSKSPTYFMFRKRTLSSPLDTKMKLWTEATPLKINFACSDKNKAHFQLKWMHETAFGATQLQQTNLSETCVEKKGTWKHQMHLMWTQMREGILFIS